MLHSWRWQGWMWMKIHFCLSCTRKWTWQPHNSCVVLHWTSLYTSLVPLMELQSVQVGSTHPTGMLSCWINICRFHVIKDSKVIFRSYNIKIVEFWNKFWILYLSTKTTVNRFVTVLSDWNHNVGATGNLGSYIVPHLLNILDILMKGQKI